MPKGLKIFLIWAVFGGVLCAAWLGWYHVEEVSMPVRIEIEEAIQVENLENKFLVIRGIRFGGAGAGGIAIPQITCGSSEQFLSQVQAGEPIYAHLETVVGEEGKIVAVDKVYSSFIRGDVLLQYRDTYQKEGFWVEKHSQRAIHFKRDNQDSVIVFTIFFSIIGGCIGDCEKPPKNPKKTRY